MSGRSAGSGHRRKLAGKLLARSGSRRWRKPPSPRNVLTRRPRWRGAGQRFESALLHSMRRRPGLQRNARPWRSMQSRSISDSGGLNRYMRSWLRSTRRGRQRRRRPEKDSMRKSWLACVKCGPIRSLQERLWCAQASPPTGSGTRGTTGTETTAAWGSRMGLSHQRTWGAGLRGRTKTNRAHRVPYFTAPVPTIWLLATWPVASMLEAMASWWSGLPPPSSSMLNSSL
mmetsp:Transcript_20044/g.55789  ORF Transcript_20044/g.55789 Transcript_20044/m.55789 type:complete len:229 (+) Transcript_20044:736-1422(+)